MDPRLKKVAVDGFNLVSKYSDILIPLASALAAGKIKKSLIVALVKEAMTESSDAQMRAELDKKK